MNLNSGESPTDRVLDSSASRHAWRDLLVLTLLCFATYLPGLTSQGLANWQEAQRALVAREMQSRGEWVLPTVDGKAYLAKPPMIYWCQMGLAALRCSRSGELELRLSVALAGWLGVLATYLAGRRMLAAEDGFGAIEGVEARLAAWCASLFLATGILYVRSSRIGELDILLAPFTVVAIAAVFEAWRSFATRGRASFAWVAMAALASVGAALSKGPPAVLVLGLAAYGGIALSCANERLAEGATPARRTGSIAGLIIGLVLSATVSWPQSAAGFLGVAFFGLFGALVAAGLIGLLNPLRARKCIRIYSRTHPVIVLGAPLLAYFLWMWAASARAGAGVAAASLEAERADNLRLFVLDSPINNLRAAAYGAGLASLCAAGALVWLAKGRVKLGPTLWALLAWTVGGLIAFSTLGKGVGRYLTPVWPGLALLGGIWFAHVLARVRRPKLMGSMVAAAVLALAAGQSLWYGRMWARRQGDRSPRELIAELIERDGAAPDRLGMFEFDTPAVDFYAGNAVPSYLDVSPRKGMQGVGPLTIANLRESLARSNGEAVLLVRRTQPSDLDPGPAVERLRGAGLSVAEVPTAAHFVIDNFKTEVDVVRVRAR